MRNPFSAAYNLVAGRFRMHHEHEVKTPVEHVLSMDMETRNTFVDAASASFRELGQTRNLIKEIGTATNASIASASSGVRESAKQLGITVDSAADRLGTTISTSAERFGETMKTSAASLTGALKDTNATFVKMDAHASAESKAWREGVAQHTGEALKIAKPLATAATAALGVAAAVNTVTAIQGVHQYATTGHKLNKLTVETTELTKAIHIVTLQDLRRKYAKNDKAAIVEERVRYMLGELSQAAIGRSEKMALGFSVRDQVACGMLNEFLTAEQHKLEQLGVTRTYVRTNEQNLLDAVTGDGVGSAERIPFDYAHLHIFTLSGSADTGLVSYKLSLSSFVREKGFIYGQVSNGSARVAIDVKSPMTGSECEDVRYLIDSSPKWVRQTFKDCIFYGLGKDLDGFWNRMMSPFQWSSAGGPASGVAEYGTIKTAGCGLVKAATGKCLVLGTFAASGAFFVVGYTGCKSVSYFFDKEKLYFLEQDFKRCSVDANEKYRKLLKEI